MGSRITVAVVRRRDRKRYIFRWPGGSRTAKAKWGNEKEAYREALQLEEELNTRRESDVTYYDACWRYEDWHLVHLSKKHQNAWKTAKNRLDAWLDGRIVYIDELDSRDLSQFVAEISQDGISMETVRNYCRYLRGFLNWCYEQEWIDRVPKVGLPRRKRGEVRSKGRPLTTEEFERMCAVVPSVVKDPESWVFLLKGLWESSLRLGEALQLHWTNPPVRLDLSGRYPMVQFEAEGHKGKTEMRFPVAPPFAQILPKEPGNGFVFRPVLSRGVTRSLDTWSHTIAAFGKKARIVVSRNSKTEKIKYASAHDLRRSFLDRWKSKVDSSVLRLLARHESIQTTQQYYLGDDAEKVAEAIWGE